MPNCIQFKEKATNEVISLNVLDERICTEVLKVPVHPENYGGGYSKGCFNWFDTIAYRIATSSEIKLGDGSVLKSYTEDPKNIWKEEMPIITSIIDFLEENFESSSWYSNH